MSALRFLLRRLLLLVPILFGVLLFTFLLIRVGSNDPVGMLAGPTATEGEIEQIKGQLRLDLPIWQQFFEFARMAAMGDLGRSWLSGNSVLVELMHRLPATLELVLLGALIGGAIGVPAGIVAATRPNGTFDQASRLISLFGFGMPTIFLGLVAIFVFFYLLRAVPPPMGRLDLMISAPATVTGSYLIDALIAGNWAAAASAGGRLILPVSCVAIVFAAPLIKQSRAIALDVLASDYVRFGRAQGLPPRLLSRMVWRNSSVPVVTYAATELVALFGTAAVLELIFSWGGVSQFGLTAILRGDFAVVQGYALLMSLVSVAVFAAADLIVAWIEPRAGLA